jgi:hypothetical protein
MDIHNMLIIQSQTMHGLMVEEIVERIFFLHRYDSRKKNWKLLFLISHILSSFLFQNVVENSYISYKNTI